MCLFCVWKEVKETVDGCDKCDYKTEHKSNLRKPMESTHTHIYIYTGICWYPHKKPSLVLPSSSSFPPPPLLLLLLHSVTFFTSTFTSTEVPLFFQQVGKCYIWLRPYRRGLRFGTYLGWNFRFGLRSRGQNVSKWLFFDTNAQIGSVRSCSNGLKFGMNIGLYMGQTLG